MKDCWEPDEDAKSRDDTGGCPNQRPFLGTLKC